MIGVCSSVYVVGDVGTDICGLVSPLDASGQTLDVAHDERFDTLLAGVGVAFDVILAALPVPGRR